MNIPRMPQVTVSIHYKNSQSTSVQSEVLRDSRSTTEVKTTTATRTTSKITEEKRRIENEIKALSDERERLDRMESRTDTGTGVDVVV